MTSEVRPHRSDIASYSNLIDILRSLAEQMPDSLALTFLRDGESSTDTITYSDLYGRAADIAHCLTEYKAHGERVMVIHPPGTEFLSAMFGCWMAGAIPVPSYPPSLRRRGASRFAHIARDAKPLLVLTTRKALQRITVDYAREAGLEGMFWIATDALPKTHAEAVVAPSSELALLQYTSGSTGDPKGVMLTHTNLISNIAAIDRRIPRENRVGVLWLPPYHDMGLIGGLLAMISTGTPLVQMDPMHFFERPIRWLRAITAHRGTVSVGVNFAYDLCAKTLREEDRAGLDLSSWQVAFNGAETVRAETLDRFATAFKQCGFTKEAFLPCYGLAEATLLVTGGNAGQPSRTVRGAVSCGYSVSDTEVVIAGEDGRLLAEGSIGEILVAGPGVCGGYWQGTEESARMFHGKYLRTGDLGYLEGGELFVTGRIKDLIIVRGRNYYPADIEAAADSAHPAIAHNGAAAFSIAKEDEEAIAVVCELRREHRHHRNLQSIIDTVERAVAIETGVAPHIVALVNPGIIPRTTSGKIRRAELRRLFAEKALKVLATNQERRDHGDIELPADASLTGRIRNIIASMRGVDPAWLEDSRPLAELGVDSLMRTDILITLETDFAIRLADETVSAEATIQDLVAAVASRTKDSVTEDPTAFEPLPDMELPLSPGQSTFLESRTDTSCFSTTILLRVPAPVDAHLLRSACEMTEDQFDSLRLRFARNDSGWSQRYAIRGGGVAFELIEVTDRDSESMLEQRRRIDRLPDDLDATTGPVLKAMLFTTGAAEPAVMVLSVHHLVADGMSAALIARAIDRNYRDLLAGLQSPRVFARPSFGEWTSALAKKAQSGTTVREVGDWVRITSDLPPRPVQAPPCLQRSHERYLSQAQQRRLDAVATTAEQQQHLFLAALWSAWSELTDETSFVALLEHHGRSALADCMPIRTAGWFVNEFPVRFEAGPASLSCEEREDRVRAAIRALPNRGIGFGMLRYLTTDREARATVSALPLPQVSFRFPRHLYTPDPATKLRFLRYYSVPPRQATSPKWSIDILVQQKSGISAWHATHDDSIDRTFAQALVDGIERYVHRRLSKN